MPDEAPSHAGHLGHSGVPSHLGQEDAFDEHDLMPKLCYSMEGEPTFAFLRGSVPRKARMSAFLGRLSGGEASSASRPSHSMLTSIADVLAQVGAYPALASSSLSAAQA